MSTITTTGTVQPFSAGQRVKWCARIVTAANTWADKNPTEAARRYAQITRDQRGEVLGVALDQIGVKLDSGRMVRVAAELLERA